MPSHSTCANKICSFRCGDRVTWLSYVPEKSFIQSHTQHYGEQGSANPSGVGLFEAGGFEPDSSYTQLFIRLSLTHEELNSAGGENFSRSLLEQLGLF